MRAIRGIIDRRILINFRVDPRALQEILPPPFQPKLVAGFGIAGICLIRLKRVRPGFLPARVGAGSENAAHRIAVTWSNGDARHNGVFIPRRDTNSRLNTLLGGRLFPGVHHHATFEVEEDARSLNVSMVSDDGQATLAVQASLTDALPTESLFKSVSEASRFFEEGSVGYSPGRTPGRYEGLELRAFQWSVMPLAVDRVASSYFGAAGPLANASPQFDCALLMRGIDHEWHGKQSLYCDWPA